LVSLTRRRGLLAIGLAAVAGGIVVLVLGQKSDFYSAPVATSSLIAITVWSFGFAGIVATMLRPGNRTGALMIWAGFTWLLAGLQLADEGLPYTIGLLASSLPLGSVPHLLLAFPDSRLSSWPARLTTGAGYFVGGPLQFAAALFVDPTGGGACSACPANLALVESNAGVASALSKAVSSAAIAVALAALLLIILRWLAATRPARRATAPVLIAGAIAAAVAAVLFAANMTSSQATTPARLATFAAVALVPFAYLAALLRTRLARGAVTRLVLELSGAQAPGRLREAIGRALRDPSLQVAYWLPERETYVDVHGAEVRLPAEGSGRAVTVVERDGRRVAALVHDPSLAEQRALVEGVAAAAGLALENERLQADLRARLEQLSASEARLRALVDASPLAIVETERDGRVTFWNRAAEELFGWTAEEALGREISFLHPESDPDPNWIRRRLAAGEPVATGETVRRRKDGTLVDVAISAAPIRGADGELVRRMAVASDISERKRIEAELRASRARIVEATDQARRRLERNLHDGAQQRLVALSLALRMATAQLHSSPQAAEEILAAASEELSQALEELRELARGIHPAVLIDRGLEAALEALAGRSPVPVDVHVELASRLPEQVEVAAYYVVSEALANVAKYAGASSVIVTVGQENGTARVDVVDDGVGGADPLHGSGLRGLADRVEALDGHLVVTSEPGRGTRVHAEIPLA
jgi:PAS domain S-box-containing protein